MHVQLLSGIRTLKLCLNLYLPLLQHVVTYHPTLNVSEGKTCDSARCYGLWLDLLTRRLVSRVLSHNATLIHLRIGLRTHRTERLGNATASRAYVAVTLHDRLVGDRAAQQLRKLSMLLRCRGVLSHSRYVLRSQVDS